MSDWHFNPVKSLHWQQQYAIDWLLFQVIYLFIEDFPVKIGDAFAMRCMHIFQPSERLLNMFQLLIGITNLVHTHTRTHTKREWKKKENEGKRHRRQWWRQQKKGKVFIRNDIKLFTNMTRAYCIVIFQRNLHEAQSREFVDWTV